VLTPKLFELVEPLRELMNALLGEGEKAELHVTESDSGPDVAIRWSRKLTSTISARIAQWVSRKAVARVTANGEVATELAPPTITLGKAQVAMPPECFLQPTREGEAALLLHVREAMKGAKTIADLFAGLGTFALPLAEHARVHAVEQDKAALGALASAARATQGLKPLTTEARDLFRQPLIGDELKAFDALVLDPPRAGAVAQARALAASRVRRIAYVSCNAESFARDARILVDGGYKPNFVTPVDQFLWSSHIELAASFART